jgi:hypothetical protein
MTYFHEKRTENPPSFRMTKYLHIPGGELYMKQQITHFEVKRLMKQLDVLLEERRHDRENFQVSQKKAR